MDLVLALVIAADPVPEPEDVRAGWTGFWILIAMAVATGLLMWSFTRQIRRTKDNAARGVFGPVEEPDAADEAETGDIDSSERR